MKKFYPITIALISTFFLCIKARAAEPQIVKARLFSGTIIVDGDLDEDIWDETPAIENFTQRELDNGRPATEKTKVKILYDSENLYIGVEANDSEPDKIIAKESKRDFDWSSDDNIRILLGPYNNQRDAYLFVINPNGAIADALITDDGSAVNKDWNGVWDAKVAIDEEEGWEIEIVIPFSNFKFPEIFTQLWALNIERNIRRKNEQVLWQGWSRDYKLENVSRAGTLSMSNISAGSAWEFKPYLTAGWERVENINRGKLKLGGDINYLLSPSVELNLTLNTDFSQVESDRDEINLSRYSILFPEKRDFFLEGQKLFEFNLDKNVQAFYSRQIGLIGNEEERKEVSILGGARMVGKTGNTNFGIMTIQTGAKDSIHSTNFSALRIKQDILEQSNIGFILTSKNNDQNSASLYGIDAHYSSSEFLDNKNLKMGLAFSQTITGNSLNKNELAYSAYLEYPNDFSEFRFNTARITKDYNPQIGFTGRKDYKLLSTELQFNPRPAFLPWVKNFEIKPFELDYYLADRSNNLESLEYEFRPLGIEFKSGDVVEFNIERIFERFDVNFELVDQVSIPAGDYWFTRYELGLETYKSRDVFVESQLSWGEFYSGSAGEFESVIGLNLSKFFNISADWERNIINLKNTSFTTDEIGSRLEYAFNPQLNTSLFNQWNSEDDEAIINFRLNWIPKTGSYFYFVVNQKYATSGNLKVLDTSILSKLTWFLSY